MSLNNKIQQLQKVQVQIKQLEKKWKQLINSIQKECSHLIKFREFHYHHYTDQYDSSTSSYDVWWVCSLCKYKTKTKHVQQRYGLTSVKKELYKRELQ